MSFPPDHNDDSAREMRQLEIPLGEWIRQCVGDTTGSAIARRRAALRLEYSLERMLEIVRAWQR